MLTQVQQLERLIVETGGVARQAPPAQLTQHAPTHVEQPTDDLAAGAFAV